MAQAILAQGKSGELHFAFVLCMFTWYWSGSWSDSLCLQISLLSVPEESFLEMHMFTNMSSEERDYMEGQRTKMLSLEQMIATLVAAGTAGGKGGGKGDGDERARALLNRKDFGLVDKFEGNQSKFKSWLFDLLTALGSVDQNLGKEANKLLKARPKIVMEWGSLGSPR